MSAARPSRVSSQELRRATGTSDGGLRLGIAIDGASHGSKLVFGLEWIRPGTERALWAADEETYEAYYVQSGSLRVTWSAPEVGESQLAAGDCFYFAPGHTYGIENVGEDEVVVVWAITPSMPEPLDVA
jgi:mannose-6-phosphate isomerase-like protein (cupin superfamily)